MLSPAGASMGPVVAADALPVLCPGSNDVDPPRQRHGFVCASCGYWWTAQLILGLGYIPGHVDACPAPVEPAQLRMAL